MIEPRLDIDFKTTSMTESLLGAFMTKDARPIMEDFDTYIGQA